MKKKLFFLLFLVIILIKGAFSQTDSLKQSSFKPFSKKRLAIVTSTEAALYGSSMIGLNQLWYANYPRASFHFFNDNYEWMQMDKCGHFTTSYYIGKVGIGLLKWSGVERKKAIWYGGILGSIYQNTIEVMDGYSSEWGFSVGDFTANTCGSILVIAQELAWDEQRVSLKFSYLPSPYQPYRKDELGSNWKESWLKDYNGQTYWISVNLASFMKKSTKFPHWLNLAMGYGANGMTGGDFNPPYIDADGWQINFVRYRQFYLSLDADLSRIPVKSKFLKTVFNTIGFIKLPAPSIEFNRWGVGGHLIGF
jgi:hypothetical protein